MRSDAFASYMHQIVQTVIRALVDDPGAVEITPLGGETIVKLEIRVAPHDREHVIGPQGQTLGALRTLMRAAGARTQRHVLLEMP